jgi:cytochrome c oxidase subunit II
MASDLSTISRQLRGTGVPPVHPSEALASNNGRDARATVSPRSLCKLRASKNAAACGLAIRRAASVFLEALTVSLLAASFIGCDELRSNHSALNPNGPQSHHITNTWWTYFAVCVVAYVFTIVTMLYGTFRRTDDDAPIAHPDIAGEKRVAKIVGAAVAITTTLLLVLMVTDFICGRDIHRLSYSPNPVHIRLTGHQWWWEARYEDDLASNIFTTANEIHIPVSPQAVRIDLTSDDVIHSLWVPNLHGKKDLVPGHETSIWLAADKPGDYWGQCAEYCGFQHALMRIKFVAESKESFDSWEQQQRQISYEPRNSAELNGRETFLTRTCVMCHTIDGTRAHGAVGPNLTHFASRSTIGSGAISNIPYNLRKWIANPHQFKPGVRMTQNTLPEKDLDDLVAYLENLK